MHTFSWLENSLPRLVMADVKSRWKCLHSVGLPLKSGRSNLIFGPLGAVTTGRTVDGVEEGVARLWIMFT